MLHEPRGLVVVTRKQADQENARALRRRMLETAEATLEFILERHDERCGCHGEACDLGSDLAEFAFARKAALKKSRPP